MMVCAIEMTYFNVFEFRFRRVNLFNWILIGEVNSANFEVIFMLKLLQFARAFIGNV